MERIEKENVDTNIEWKKICTAIDEADNGDKEPKIKKNLIKKLKAQFSQTDKEPRNDQKKNRKQINYFPKNILQRRHHN